MKQKLRKKERKTPICFLSSWQILGGETPTTHKYFWNFRPTSNSVVSGYITPMLQQYFSKPLIISIS